MTEHESWDVTIENTLLLEGVEHLYFDIYSGFYDIADVQSIRWRDAIDGPAGLAKLTVSGSLEFAQAVTEGNGILPHQQNTVRVTGTFIGIEEGLAIFERVTFVSLKEEVLDLYDRMYENRQQRGRLQQAQQAMGERLSQTHCASTPDQVMLLSDALNDSRVFDYAARLLLEGSTKPDVEEK